MFSKTERPDAKSSGLPSIISKDMTITGNIQSPGTVQVEGKVIGDIECNDLTLGENGEVHGEIKCDVATIHGTIVGELQAETVNIAASAKVKGDIVHENVSIEAHARVEGQLIHRDTPPANLNLVTTEEGTTT